MTGGGLGEGERMEGGRETEKTEEEEGEPEKKRKEGKEEGGGRCRNWMRKKQKSLLSLQNGPVPGNSQSLARLYTAAVAFFSCMCRV